MVVTGVLAALLCWATTGRGGEVTTSLYETALGWMLYHGIRTIGLPLSFNSVRPGRDAAAPALGEATAAYRPNG